jgi:hypothetical protein
MRPDDPLPPQARAFAQAAARLAREAVLLVEEERAILDPRAARALEEARQAAEDVALLARAGAPVEDAYGDLARTLQAAAVELTVARARSR